ncbi:MAG: rhodanese-like domain-containing protein [Proteobacteria bacterium]|nr:rhodanese-like domain-containing protein [Pseudomonadota bacterium]
MNDNLEDLNINANLVAEEISQEGTGTYVDVRTVAEFATNRPKGRAVNIPIVFFHPSTKEEHPNPAFELVARHALKDEDVIIVGGNSDNRALEAARRLQATGFLNIRILRKGVEEWNEATLPLTGDNRPGVSYASLLTAARRAKK